MEINEKGLERILEEQRKEYQHFMGVLVEKFQSGLNLIGEQYVDIKKTPASHTEMIGSIKMDVEIMKGDIGFMKNLLKKKVDFEEFEALEKRVRFLESKVRA